jgi:periplasmic protein TonB
MFPDDEEEDRNFIQRHPGLVLLSVVALLGVIAFYVGRALSNHNGGGSRQNEEIVIRLPPPPPPPPPKPIPTPPPTPPDQTVQKMIEQVPTKDVQKPQPAAPKEAPIGTGITGPGGGPDFGLASGLGGSGYGNGSGGAGSKYGWYASEVQTAVSGALRSNPKTRTASMNIVVRIWPDSTGRVIKARIAGSTGDPALDSALQNDILTGLQLNDPPPADMPLPIVMRLSAQRPQ